MKKRYYSLLFSFALMFALVLSSFGVSNNYSSAYLREPYLKSTYTSLNPSYTFDISTWSTKSWSGLSSFSGYRVWTDGIDFYFSSSTQQYVLDKSTSTWSVMSWNGLGSFNGDRVWSDGSSIYYSSSTQQYVLDVSTHTWNSKNWDGFTSFNGSYIWTDGVNFYHSLNNKHYVLDKSTSLWTSASFTGLTSFNGSNVWHLADNTYYSDGSQQYVLDKSTSTWSAVNSLDYNGLIKGADIWTDGVNYYYSNSVGNSFILNQSTMSWSEISFSVSDVYISGRHIWTDGENIYFSFSSYQYYVAGSYTSPPVPASPYDGVGEEILAAFTGGFVGLLGTFGDNLSTIASDLFIVNYDGVDFLSPFGIIVITFMSICLIICMVRFILNFLIKRSDY